jgi:hypothetical protein
MASGQIANPMDKDEVAKFIAEEFNMSIEAANKWAE